MSLLRDLFYEGGRFSSSRAWRHVAYALTTFIVWKMGTNVTFEILGLYLAVVALDNRAGAIIRAKFGQSPTQEAPPAGSAKTPNE